METVAEDESGLKLFQAENKPYLGQKKARLLLDRAIRSARLAHGYLFSGPDGIGKKLFAHAIAAAINCESGTGIAGCGHCVSCRKLAGGSHPDFITVTPEKGVIKINQVRELTKTLSYAPYEAATRVVLMEDVHTMGREAANSLLKTLEEPPPDNLLILTADSSQAMLPTIASRCQVVPFYPLSQKETVEVIVRENDKIDHETALLLARLAEGSPGRALLLYEKKLIELYNQVAELFADKSDAGDSGVGRVLKTAEAMAELKEDLISFLGLLRLWARDEIFAGAIPDSSFLADLAWKDWSSQQYFAKLQAISQAEKELKRNCNRSLVCEVLLFRLQHCMQGSM